MQYLCCTCKIDKSSNDFCKNKNTKMGLSAQCKECAKQYRQAHQNTVYPSTTLDYKRNYYLNNKEHINFLRRNTYQNNLVVFRKKAKVKYLLNKSFIRNYQRKWYLNNLEYHAQRNKKYRLNNHYSIYLRNRKRKLSLSGNISHAQIIELLSKYNHKCAYCYTEVKEKMNLHLDHKMPLSRGGKHHIDNLAPSCASCNLQKGTKTDLEFMNKGSI